MDCTIDGKPVYWKSDCISVSVQADGAPAAGIDYAAARASVERAFAAWMNVTCPGGGHPSLRVEITDPVACSRAEYNRDKRNANIIVFRDDSWPYQGQSQDVLGYTRINFDTNTGELYDVDIELNAVTEPLAVGRPPKPTEADLDSILTHEVGHFLGLNHSRNVEATMVAGYQAGSMELRTPSADDIAGICAIYPPERASQSNDCAPRHGFSELCGAEQTDPPLDDPMMEGDASPERAGCALVSAGGQRSRWEPLALLGVLALRRRRVRAARR
jgi:Matrixin